MSERPGELTQRFSNAISDFLSERDRLWREYVDAQVDDAVFSHTGSDHVTGNEISDTLDAARAVLIDHGADLEDAS